MDLGKGRSYAQLPDSVEVRLAVVAARWNEPIVSGLLAGTQRAVAAVGIDLGHVQTVRVPGSYELPIVCRELCLSGRFDAVVALGALIKGETDHYDLVARDVSSALMRLMLDTGIPVTFGVVTAHTLEAAQARSGDGEMNKGFEAAMAAVETCVLLKQIRSTAGG